MIKGFPFIKLCLIKNKMESIIRDGKGRFVKGNQHSLDSKIRISNILKKMYVEGKMKSWNKGLTIKDERIKKWVDNLRSKDYKGYWLGKKRDEKTKRKISESRFKNGTNIHSGSFKKGHEVPQGWRENSSKIIKNNLNNGKILRCINCGSFIGKNHNCQDNINKISESRKRQILERPDLKEILKQNRINQILPVKDTKIEIKIQNFLKELQIDFFTHQYININHAYQCDILIPSMNLVIEADGNYWHKYPIGNDLDHIRTKELLEKGFKVLRLWEVEIKEMDINKFREKLMEVKIR